MGISRRTLLTKAWNLASISTISMLIAYSATFAKNIIKPGHLQNALLLLNKLTPENNNYQHGNTIVSWAGFNGATDYISKTDCSGFLNELLFHSYGYTSDKFLKWMTKRRPKAKDYYEAILQQRNFIRVFNIKEIKPGDIIAIKYPKDEDETGNTGHVMLVENTAKQIDTLKPIIEGTKQWIVTIIDQSQSAHGKKDTRRNPDGSVDPGLGRGVFRIYVNETEEIVGYTWSTFKNSDFYSVYQRPLVVGRLKA
jgi:signal peptidase I